MSLALLPDSEPLASTDPAFVTGVQHKFPHTRAQLAAFARQYKSSDDHDTDPDVDELSRVPTSLVNKVVALLVDEREDELKTLLKDTYNVDDHTVRLTLLSSFLTPNCSHRSTKMSLISCTSTGTTLLVCLFSF